MIFNIFSKKPMIVCNIILLFIVGIKSSTDSEKKSDLSNNLSDPLVIEATTKMCSLTLNDDKDLSKHSNKPITELAFDVMSGSYNDQEKLNNVLDVDLTSKDAQKINKSTESPSTNEDSLTNSSANKEIEPSGEPLENENTLKIKLNEEQVFEKESSKNPLQKPILLEDNENSDVANSESENDSKVKQPENNTSYDETLSSHNISTESDESKLEHQNPNVNMNQLPVQHTPTKITQESDTNNLHVDTSSFLEDQIPHDMGKGEEDQGNHQQGEYIITSDKLDKEQTPTPDNNSNTSDTSLEKSHDDLINEETENNDHKSFENQESKPSTTLQENPETDETVDSDNDKNSTEESSTEKSNPRNGQEYKKKETNSNLDNKTANKETNSTNDNKKYIILTIFGSFSVVFLVGTFYYLKK